eukprot:sb/3472681/
MSEGRAPRGKEPIKRSQTPDTDTFDGVFQPPEDAQDFSHYTSILPVAAQENRGEVCPPTQQGELVLAVDRVRMNQVQLAEEVAELRRSTQGTLNTIIFELGEIRRAVQMNLTTRPPSRGGVSDLEVAQLERELVLERARRKRLEEEHEREMEDVYRQLSEAL